MRPPDSRKLISIVVPVYNEQGNIAPLYQAVDEVMTELADRYRYELVFTDNHSSDDTFAELAELAERDPRVRVFRFSKNFGFQRSIVTALRMARGAAAIQLDCDLQDPPRLILDFVREWEDGYKVVYGSRRSRKEGRIISGLRKLFYRVINFLSEDELPYDAGDFRLVDRQLLDELGKYDDEKPYLRGSLATMGFDQKQIPYDRAARTIGKSKFSMRDLFGLALDGILSHSTVPLRLATYTGLIISVVTFIMLLGYLVSSFLFGKDWPAGFATLVLLILLSLSLNALFLGVIGEYVGRIYHQVRRRPLTIIEQAIDRAPPEGAPAEPARSKLAGDRLGSRDRPGVRE
jgi:dolichol-phosphate mannosyltransferase